MDDLNQSNRPNNNTGRDSQAAKSVERTNPNLQPGLRNEWCVCFVLTLLAVFLGPCLGKNSLPIAALFGAVLAMASGTVIIVPVQYYIRWRSGIPWGAGEPKTASILGYVERAFVFSASALHNGSIVIAGWIALKSISHWKGWEESGHDFGKGRSRFNMFLMGTALSIMAAVAGALFALWLYSSSDLPKVFTFGVPADTS